MKKIVMVAALVLIAAAIVFLSNKAVPNDPYTMYYEGDYRHFRGNLVEANKTLVYPNEDAVKDVLLSPEVYKIQIAFIPGDSENAFYLASSFEITNKLSLVYRHYFNENVSIFKDTDNSTCLLFFNERQARCFKSVFVNSTDELVPTPVEPVILLLGPSNSNRTMITVKNSLITLEAKDFSETNRTYTDLDLAVDKMLLILMSDDQ